MEIPVSVHSPRSCPIAAYFYKALIYNAMRFNHFITKKIPRSLAEMGEIFLLLQSLINKADDHCTH